MGIFDVFKKKAALSPEEKLNKLWDAWTDGKVPAPCAALMTYQSEVGNGGHDQYFFNVNETGDLQAEVETVLSLLPEVLKGNLQRAWDAYQSCPDAEDENDALFSECDDVFYANEQPLIDLIQHYANDLY